MPADRIRIEPLTETAQFLECEALQRGIWGMHDTDVVPLHFLTTIQRHGGLVLGAFDEECMIGFLLGFLGVDQGQPPRFKHCSHMMGVAEPWRGRGLGCRLKIAQRAHALDQGLDLVTWTYDPLESANAALNIGKLGAVSHTYVREIYGELRDELNAGLPTDRFQVEWWIRSTRVVDRVEGSELGSSSLESLLDAEAQHLNPGAEFVDGALRPPPSWEAPNSDIVLAEVPADFQSTKEASLDVARQWRLHTRELFERCFSDGYIVTGFASAARSDRRRSYYVLRREIRES